MPDDEDPNTYAACGPRLTPADVVACGCSGINLETEGTSAKVQKAIDEVLYLFDLATGFELRGPCQSTVQPLGHPGPCAGGFRNDEILRQIWPSWLPPVVPYTVGRNGENGGPILAHCWYAQACDGGPDRFRLPWLPVRSVDEIRIGADVLDATKWRHVPGTNLVLRTDGEKWPPTQELIAAPGADGTWTVKFTHGWDLPPGIDRRLASAACEVSKYCLGLPCTLPEGVRLKTKGNEEFVVIIDYRKDGLTGFPTVDDWISTWRYARKSGGGGVTTKPRMTRPGGRRAGAVRTEPWPG